MALLLRIVLSPKEARRVKLEEIPESVDQMIEVLKERLQLERDFTLQFEDPDFGNSLCQLTTISELPEGRAVLHIMWNSPLPSSPCNLSEHSINGSISSPLPPSPWNLSEHSINGSISSLDTASVHSDFRPSSSLQTPGSSSDSVKNTLRPDIKWPSPFPIPKLSYDVELKLRKGNEVYAKAKKALEVTRDIKTEILDKLAQAIFDLRGGYPAKDEVASVASALVLKYPCLKDEDSITGCEAWLMSLRYKIGNFRAKLRDAGCNEVDVNRKRRRGDGEDGPFTLKKPKRGEVNHVPDYPDHHDDNTLEEERLALVEEFKKRKRNMAEIRQKMELTFSLRRKEIVEMQPMVSGVKERWPALFSLEEISQEFCRITSKDLLVTFRASLDKYVLRLLKLYRARKGAFGPEMEDLLNKLDEETRDIVSLRKTAALRGLPIFIREDASTFFLKCLETDSEDAVVRGVTVGILTVYEDDHATTSPTVQDIAVVLEGVIILNELPDLSTAFAYLFGLLYAINIEYPKSLKYTFEAIQTIFFELGSRCSQRIRSLKLKLLQ